ncbi:MAG: alpha/beta hydrolase [Actinobacteria bacterium]|nr:alpha/beta hydrolase [Actinomycetota bacterium]MCB9413460.1 alpha/beta hydrolase [Actinomycetota bacterium]
MWNSVANETTAAARRDHYRAAEQAMWQHHGAGAPVERWTDVGALGIRVRTLDVGAGRPVLFVHGGPNAGATWGPLVGHLDGVRALAVDRPGCGLSDPLDYSTISTRQMWDALVTTLVAVLEDADTGPVDAVGSSFGGACVLWLARQRPDLVHSIVLEGVPLVEGMVLAPNLRPLAIRPLGRLIARLPARDADVRRTFRQLGHECLVTGGWPSGPDRDWGLSMMNDTATMRNEVRLIQKGASWRGFRPGVGFDSAALGGITAPTLWIVGDRDPFGSVALVESWAHEMPAAALTVMPDSGHLPWLDDPEEHARLIEDFWSSRPNPSASASHPASEGET